MPSSSIKLFLCGDVMTGRGIDQILPNPCNPRLYEEYMASAEGYVRLAEDAHGDIPRSAPLSYIWGAALDEFERVKPALRIVNLETSVTRSESYFAKGINYRMSPENAGCLTSAGVDCCKLANIKTAGAGRRLAEAWAPAVFEIPGKGRVLVFSCACVSSGAPMSWAATDDAGVALLPDLSEASVSLLVREMSRAIQSDDVIVLSVHHGPNWGYEVRDEDRYFAHRLAERGCSFDAGKDTGRTEGHAYVTVRLGNRKAVIPDVGTHKRLDPEVVRKIVDELGLNWNELPGPSSRA
jgi:poly-gamma-glutamate capsule biosynthesis protein CapA/YwtB (metallophosphatase superfamily)